MIIVEKPNNTAGNGDSHAEDIDEQIQLVLQHTSKCNQKEVFNHDVVGLLTSV